VQTGGKQPLPDQVLRHTLGLRSSVIRRC
jgi:hypothetical protein